MLEPFPSSVKNSVPDGCCGCRDTDFADTAGVQRIEFRARNGERGDIKSANVRVHWNVIFREIGVYIAAMGFVEDRAYAS